MIASEAPKFAFFNLFLSHNNLFASISPFYSLQFTIMRYTDIYTIHAQQSSTMPLIACLRPSHKIAIGDRIRVITSVESCVVAFMARVGTLYHQDGEYLVFHLQGGSGQYRFIAIPEDWVRVTILQELRGHWEGWRRRFQQQHQQQVPSVATAFVVVSDIDLPVSQVSHLSPPPSRMIRAFRSMVSLRRVVTGSGEN